MKIGQLFLGLGLGVLSAVGLAQTYPSKPVTLVVGFPPGGGADAVARQVADQLGRQLGQPMILDYRPGGGTTLASAYVAKAAPDGYTVYMTSASHYGADKVLYKNSVKYDGNSFTPIARWTRTPLILAVGASSGLASTQDLVTHAKAKPGELSYSSSGSGGAPHLAALQFEAAANLKMLHVPFKGGAPAVTAVASGDVQLTFGTPPSIIPLAQTGRVKMIAVTSAERSAAFPNLPTLSEAGIKDIDYTFWFGLFGPAGLPKEIVDRLAEASAKALAEPELKAKLAASGNSVSVSKSPAEFAAWAQSEGQHLKMLTEKSGATVD